MSTCNGDTRMSLDVSMGVDANMMMSVTMNFNTNISLRIVGLFIATSLTVLMCCKYSGFF
jgi:hypothetical protein